MSHFLKVSLSPLSDLRISPCGFLEVSLLNHCSNFHLDSEFFTAISNLHLDFLIGTQVAKIIVNSMF